jgi:hypothetical protein
MYGTKMVDLGKNHIVWHVTTSSMTCHSFVTTVSQLKISDFSTVSQLKISDFSGEMFEGFEVLYFSMSATTTQLLYSGEFCTLRYDTIPVKSASADISFYTNNFTMPNSELQHSCCK